MGLQAVYKSQDQIPEGLVDYYKELADGTFKIDLDGGTKTQADIDRVKESLKKERDKNEELTRELSRYPDEFDPEQWEKVKDIDPENLPKGDIDEDTEKEIQKRVAAQVREKEREIKEAAKKESEKEKNQFDQERKEWSRKMVDYKLKQDLANAGFTNPEMLDNLILQLKHGDNKNYEDLRSLYKTLEADNDNGFEFVGGDLKDKQGWYDTIERFKSHEISEKHKPAADNSGGGANPNLNGNGEVKDNPFKIGEHHNVTKQSKIINEHPDQARRLAKEAGWSEQEIETIK